jgi:hypothetical protein
MAGFTMTWDIAAPLTDGWSENEAIGSGYTAYNELGTLTYRDAILRYSGAQNWGAEQGEVNPWD